MHWYQTALLVGAVIVGILAWNVPRAVLWISLGGMSFVAGSGWHDAGLPHGAAFGAFTNFMICFALYAVAELRWEMRVWNCFHLMIVLDILYLTGFIESHYDFAVGLEIANWMALLVIGAAGLMQRIGHGVFSGRDYSSGVSLFRNALYSKRRDRPFWENTG